MMSIKHRQNQTVTHWAKKKTKRRREKNLINEEVNIGAQAGVWTVLI